MAVIRTAVACLFRRRNLDGGDYGRVEVTQEVLSVACTIAKLRTGI